MRKPGLRIKLLNLLVVPTARLLGGYSPRQELRHHEELHTPTTATKDDRALTVFTTFSNIEHI